MQRSLLGLSVIAASAAAVICGCRSRDVNLTRTQADHAHYRTVATQIDYPDLHEPPSAELHATLPPRTLNPDTPPVYWDLPLAEAIQMALARSTVIRDVGGRVVSAPTASSTTLDPAVRESDPRTGPEAALTAFDAQFSTQVFWSRNERAFNNVFFGGGAAVLDQDRGDFVAEISKRSAVGTQMFIRNNTNYDWNSSRANLFPSAWNTNIEAEIRQPFLQGGGLEFNRIAGPNATPGNYNGVLVARVNTDITLADFEAAVTTLVRDVERTYWDLYFAYRDLDARIAGRESALQTWRSVRRKADVGAAGGDDEAEARAREQYYSFQADVENALSGRSAAAGIAGIGVTVTGIYAHEARLRYLLGLTANDGRLIRPADEPSTAEVVLDWDRSLAEALVRRVELRRQKWLVKRRQLELIASRNFLWPRVDGVALYRWRGFGDDLLDPNRDGRGEFDNAFANLTQGDFQEWQLGIQANVPIGNRIGSLAVRNAELQLSRERALLVEQELQVSHELSAAIVELDRAYHLSRTRFNQRSAAQQQLVAVRRKYEAGVTNLDFLLDAERRASDAESNYFRALVDYNVANMNAHLARGSLLDYNGVYLAEGPWPGRAHLDAAEQARYWRASSINYCIDCPLPVSAGAYEQEALTPPSVAEPVPPPAGEPKAPIPQESELPPPSQLSPVPPTP